MVMPVYNGGSVLKVCLESLVGSTFENWELIVVDDGSDDGSDVIASDFGARVIRTAGRQGPGAARNQGAGLARGEYLVFLDADCQVAPDTLANAAVLLNRDPGIDALFGSYDDEPAAQTLVSKFKNLQHHFVHQQGSEEASTFWAGCGAVRRSVFRDLGGFDIDRYTRPSIEDIELGYRLRAAGHRIVLAKNVRVKHHKRWTLLNLVKTDIFDRGIPWTVLLLTGNQTVSDLNVDRSGKASVAIAYLLVLAVVASLVDLKYIWFVIALGAALGLLNWKFYRFLLNKGGVRFTVGSIMLHWMYQLNCGFAYIVGHLKAMGTRRSMRTGSSEGST